MRRALLILMVIAMLAALIGCSSCGKKEAPKNKAGFATGYPSAEALVQAYLEAIEKKDPEMLQRLFLTPDDMKGMKQANNRQFWQAYLMVSKRAFMDKNKDYLGQKLEFVKFTLGPPAGNAQGANWYKSSVVEFKLPAGQTVSSDIPFIVEAGGTWKILGLKYIKDDLKKKGLADNFNMFEGEAKFKGVDKAQPETNIKVWKTKPKTDGAAPEPAKPEEKK